MEWNRLGIDCRPRKWCIRKEIRKIRAGFRALEPIWGRIFGLNGALTQRGWHLLTEELAGQATRGTFGVRRQSAAATALRIGPTVVKRQPPARDNPGKSK